jgi:hypothetical protein
MTIDPPDGDSKFERRRIRRIQVNGECFLVIFGNDHLSSLKVADISLKGLTYIYRPGLKIPQSNKISIATTDRKIVIKDLQYRNISDFELSAGHPSFSHHERRRGIQFVSLTHKQADQISELIEQLENQK